RDLTDPTRILPVGVCHNRDLANVSRKFADPVSRPLDIDVTLALANEIESERIRAGINSQLCVWFVGDSANLDPNLIAQSRFTPEHPAGFHSPGSITRPRTCLI